MGELRGSIFDVELGIHCTRLGARPTGLEQWGAYSPSALVTLVRAALCCLRSPCLCPLSAIVLRMPAATLLARTGMARRILSADSILKGLTARNASPIVLVDDPSPIQLQAGLHSLDFTFGSRPHRSSYSLRRLSTLPGSLTCTYTIQRPP